MTSVFPFFVGCGRSGTTLLRAMFDSHPDLAVAHETYFALWLGSNRGRYEAPQGFQTRTFVADLQRHSEPGRIDIDPEVLSADLDANPPGDTAGAIRRVYQLHAAHHGKQRYAEKSPMFVRHLPFFADLFGEARFVHLVRDGRDVALAFADVDFGPPSVAAAAVHWRAQVLAGRTAGEHLGTDRYREVRYEDLIDDPPTVLRPLCDFLDLAYEPAMLRYFERAGDVVATTSHQGYHDNLYRPPTKGLRDWRVQMPPRDVALFEALAGDALRAFGYDVASRGPSPTLRIEAQARRIGIGVANQVQQASKRVRDGWRHLAANRDPGG
jgi:hypothetical protein